jgi:hypothetical protein
MAAAADAPIVPTDADADKVQEYQDEIIRSPLAHVCVIPLLDFIDRADTYLTDFLIWNGVEDDSGFAADLRAQQHVVRSFVGA